MNHHGINKYHSFVRFFLRKYDSAISRIAQKYHVASRFDVEDLKQYIGAKILDRLKSRDKSNNPIRNPVRYFRGCLSFYCAEYRRMAGFTVSFPARPRIPGGHDEREAAEKQYVYMSHLDNEAIIDQKQEVAQDSKLTKALLQGIDQELVPAFRMLALDGLDPREAAEILGSRTSHVKLLASRATEQLQRLIQERPVLEWLLATKFPAPNKGGLYYLGAPYTDKSKEVQDRRLKSVNEAYKQLMLDKWKVHSPLMSVYVAEQAGLPTEWDFWQDLDLTMLSRMDGMFLLPLPGWLTSTGLTAELEKAFELELPVYFL